MKQRATVTKTDILEILNALTQRGMGSGDSTDQVKLSDLVKPLKQKLAIAANIHPEELLPTKDPLKQGSLGTLGNLSGEEAQRIFLLAIFARSLRTGEGAEALEVWEKQFNQENESLGRLKKGLNLEVIESSLCKRLALIDPVPLPPKPFQNKLGMNFLYLGPGKFQLGSDPGQWGATDKEAPPQQVQIRKPFYLSQFLVTQSEWKALLPNAADPSHFYGAQLPVDSVSWNHAQVFVKKLNQLEKTTAYRLPTEVEWEYACRAGTESPFFCEEKDLLGFAWLKGNGEGKSHAVGELKPNPWGLYDLLGNLLEWCSDEAFRSDYQKDREAQFNPPKRVLRGGCWRSFPKAARSAVRTFQLPDYKYYGIGFRIVRDIEPL